MTFSWLRRTALAALSLTFLMAPGRLLAAPPAAPPSASVKQFFKSVAKRDYVTSWNLFTTNSRKIIVNTLARHDKVAPAEIERQFATNDKKMQSEFWEPFRTNSHAEEFDRTATFTDGRHQGKVAEVIVAVKEGRADFITLQEPSGWKLAWMEQIIAHQRALQQQQQQQMQQQKASPQPKH